MSNYCQFVNLKNYYISKLPTTIKPHYANVLTKEDKTLCMDDFIYVNNNLILNTNNINSFTYIPDTNYIIISLVKSVWVTPNISTTKIYMIYSTNERALEFYNNALVYNLDTLKI